MQIVGIIIYLLLCVLVSWFGRDKAIGSVGFFVMSLFLTPMVVALILLVTTEKTKIIN
jgi:hypothetical protein